MTLRRVGLGLLAVSAAIVGFWAEFAPKSFYDDFPGGGHHWVRVDGPYNQHLVRDVGQWNLGSTVDPVNVAVGQPVTFRLVATGRGKR